MPISTLAAALLVLSSLAGGETLTFTPDATAIRFSLGATLHTVEGTARARESRIELDRDAQTCSGALVVDARSLETGNARRDRAMHSKVLLSESHPTMTLVCRGWRGSLEDDRIELDADFEIVGQRHEVQLELSVEVTDEALRLETAFEVPYVLWGLEDPSKALLRVKKTVQVKVEATAVRSR